MPVIGIKEEGKMKKKYKTLKIKTEWVRAEEKERDSYCYVTPKGHVIITDLGDRIFIQGCRMKGDSIVVVPFLVTKEGAASMVEGINKILEAKQ